MFRTKRGWRLERRFAAFLALFVVAAACSLVAVEGGKAMYCDVEYRSCASDDPGGGFGTGGGGTSYGFYVGQKLPGTPEFLQAHGWTCTSWGCSDSGWWAQTWGVDLKKCDDNWRYIVQCKYGLILGWQCEVTKKEDYWSLFGC